MSKNHETDHAKNVENIPRINDYIVSFGTKYVPAPAAITWLSDVQIDLIFIQDALTQ
jgi:hypothetical protein